MLKIFHQFFKPKFSKAKIVEAAERKCNKAAKNPKSKKLMEECIEESCEAAKYYPEQSY
jgi:hypothetical protein